MLRCVEAMREMDALEPLEGDGREGGLRQPRATQGAEAWGTGPGGGFGSPRRSSERRPWGCRRKRVGEARALWGGSFEERGGLSRGVEEGDGLPAEREGRRKGLAGGEGGGWGSRGGAELP